MALRNNYTGYYEQTSFGTIEQVTLAEELVFQTFEDIQGKFFYQMITPSVNANTSSPRETSKASITTANYINLTIPMSVLISIVKPQVLTCGRDPKTGCLKPGLRGYNLLYTKSLEEDGYVIPKGTKFLVEMLGGKMKLEESRIIGIVPDAVVDTTITTT